MNCEGAHSVDYIEEFGKHEFCMWKRFQCLRYLRQWVNKTELFHLQFKEILLPHWLLNIVADKESTLEVTNQSVIFPITLNTVIRSLTPKTILALNLPAVLLYKNQQFFLCCFITDILFQSTWTVPRYRCDIDILPQSSTWRSLQIVKPLTFFLQLDSLFNPLNPELNPICYLLALLGAHHFLHVSRIRVKSLTLRQLMSYIYGAPILDVSRSHTTTQHSR